MDTGESVASLFGLAPQGVCRAVAAHAGRGALLPHRFTLTTSTFRSKFGGLFSVALSVASPRLAVSQPAARESSDFPRRLAAPRSSSPLHTGVGNRIGGGSFRRLSSLSRRRREARNAAGRRRISRCATPAETHWDSTQLGKLEILRRPPPFRCFAAPGCGSLRMTNPPAQISSHSG